MTQADLAAALRALDVDLTDLVGAIHVAGDAAELRGDVDLRQSLRLLARFGEQVLEDVEQVRSALKEGAIMQDYSELVQGIAIAIHPDAFYDVTTAEGARYVLVLEPVQTLAELDGELIGVVTVRAARGEMGDIASGHAIGWALPACSAGEVEDFIRGNVVLFARLAGCYCGEGRWREIEAMNLRSAIAFALEAWTEQLDEDAIADTRAEVRP